jgi:uncharacterized damage-inducible protein DinB
MTTIAQYAASLLVRELQTMRRELEAYPDETLIWAQPPGVPNPAGTLALHVAGNLHHYIGVRLGQSAYVRDRAREFEARDVPRVQVLQELSEAEAAVRDVVPGLTEAALGATYPEVVGGQRMVTADFLMHLCSHLAYHLGQVDYHRRVVTGDVHGVGAVLLSRLKTAVPAA